MKSAVAIRHVHFESLGTFEPVLKESGYTVRYLDAWEDELVRLDGLAPDLLIVLGAPVGTYETEAYPFLAVERELLTHRLCAQRPTLGVCLGAQQIAAALGAKVIPGGYKEIGFSTLDLTPDGKSSPLRHLEGISVLHWHGDTFEIPSGALRLAGTSLCQNQAFSLGPNILGLQFHTEVEASRGLEAWFIGHACELATAKIDLRTIRKDGILLGKRLQESARGMFLEWLHLLN